MQELKFEGETWLEDLKAAIANDVTVTDQVHTHTLSLSLSLSLSLLVCVCVCVQVLGTPEFALSPKQEAFLRGDDEALGDLGAL